MVIPYKGRRLDVADLPEYLRTLEFSSFQPQGIVLHHTAVPSLSQRPQGLLPDHLVNLRDYYERVLGWSGGPHIFVDDQPQPVVEFQRLDRRGVHAKSFNRTHWGVEMLGNFNLESPDRGRGLQVYRNTLEVLACLFRHLERSPEELRFHRDDPLTNKSCPGYRIEKELVVQDLRELMALPEPVDRGAWKVRLPNGQFFQPVQRLDGRPIVPVRRFLVAMSSNHQPVFLITRDRIRMGSAEIPVAQIDETGAAWTWMRSLADSLGYQLILSGKVIRLAKQSKGSESTPYR